MSQKKLSRREFLRLSALGAAGVALSACAKKETTVEPTKAPAVVEATKAPVTEKEPTPIPTKGATATLVPTVEASKYKESPLLAEKVKAGTLPKVEDRLPKIPLVLSPVDGIGKYGGRIKTSSPWLGGDMLESQYGHSALRWIDDGMGIAPGMVESWEANADNSEWTFHFRDGLKWSDGQPCTTEDVLFWWEDLVINPDHSDQPPDFLEKVGDKLPTVTAVDATTLKFSYMGPQPLTPKRLAMWVNARIGPRWISPKHYAKQFHPKYNTEMKDFKLFDEKTNDGLFNNPEMPSLNSWVVTKWETAVQAIWDRNPYYYAVDTEGNQLPYVDGWDETTHVDAQAKLLKIMQGSVDFLNFSDMTMGDVAPVKEAEAAGDYQVRFWDTGSGTGMMYFWNHDAKDPKKRELYRNPKFKQAVSFAMDRPTIQKLVYYDTGMITTGSMSPKAIEFNYNDAARGHYKKFRDLCSAYDPDKAKALLDEIGLKDVNNDGYREYPDGSEFVFRIDVPAGTASSTSSETMLVLEITMKNWTAIGLNVVLNQMPDSEFSGKWQNGEFEWRTAWEVGDGPDHLLYPSWVIPNETERWAPLCGKMFQLQGTAQENTDCETDPWARTPPRFCTTDKDYAGTGVEKLHQLYRKAIVEVDEVKRMEMVWQMNEIHMTDGPYFLGTVCNTPRPIIVSNKLTNVPQKEQLKLGGFVNPWIIPYPAVTNPETYSFK